MKYDLIIEQLNSMLNNTKGTEEENLFTAIHALNRANQIASTYENGDKVRVVDMGKIYPTYYSWFTENAIAAEYCLGFQIGDEPNSDTVYTIVEHFPHRNSNTIIYLIQDTDSDFKQTFLISGDGLALCKS